MPSVASPCTSSNRITAPRVTTFQAPGFQSARSEAGVFEKRQENVPRGAEAVAAANRGLPDYAQVRKWLLADEPFTVHNGLLTSNGRLRRAEIWARYEAAVDKLYGEQ